MLANHSSAGLGIATNADSYTARQASHASSCAHDTVQKVQNLDETSGVYEDGSSTTVILEQMTAQQLPHKRAARHLFRPRITKVISSPNDDSTRLESKHNPRSAAIDDADAGEPADSRQSLRLIPAAYTTELDASASIASAAGATGTLPAVYSQLSLRSQLQRASSSSMSSVGQSDADRSPMGVPETLREQLPSAALIQQNTRNIHDVARLVSQLFGSQPGHEFSFGTSAPSPAAAQKRLKLQSCWPASWRKKMTGLPSCQPQLSKAEAAKIMHAAVLSQGGATISDVVLDLGKSGCLVLQGTSRTELRNVHIEGGILLCHGPQCHLNITDCSFKGCKVLFAEGATVHIHRSLIQEHFSVNNAALVVSGRGTTVHASDTHICVGRGFIVQDRATLSGTGVHVTGTNGALVTASGAGTQLTLERSDTEFMRDKSNLAVAASVGKLFRGIAVVSCDGAKTTLRDCELRDFFRGVHALRHGRVTLEGCILKASRSDGEGVYVQMGNVSMHDTKILGCGEYGACVGGGGATTTAHLFAEGCTVEGSSKTVAVQKDEWSTAEVQRCVLNGEEVTSAW